MDKGPLKLKLPGEVKLAGWETRDTAGGDAGGTGDDRAVSELGALNFGRMNMMDRMKICSGRVRDAVGLAGVRGGSAMSGEVKLAGWETRDTAGGDACGTGDDRAVSALGALNFDRMNSMGRMNLALRDVADNQGCGGALTGLVKGCAPLPIAGATRRGGCVGRWDGGGLGGLCAWTRFDRPKRAGVFFARMVWFVQRRGEKVVRGVLSVFEIFAGRSSGVQRHAGGPLSIDLVRKICKMIAMFVVHPFA